MKSKVRQAVKITISTGLLVGLLMIASVAQQATASQTTGVRQFNAEEFSRSFSHHTARVNDVRLHYVIGGRGEPMVLLHGWPQTWYAWRNLMPALAEHYTVIAPDLRGFGESDKPLTGYDTATYAEDVYQLVRSLGYQKIFLVGHDVGVAVGYSYAAAHPADVRRMAVIEMVVPGFGLDELIRDLAWHYSFNKAPDIPELLVAGKEREYISVFYKRDAYNPEAITEEDLNVYARAYSAPGALRATFGYYREIEKSTAQNREYARQKLRMPILTMGGESSLKLRPYQSFQQVATNVRDVQIKHCGHWIGEEQPAFVVQQLLIFFGEERKP